MSTDFPDDFLDDDDLKGNHPGFAIWIAAWVILIDCLIRILSFYYLNFNLEYKYYGWLWKREKRDKRKS